MYARWLPLIFGAVLLSSCVVEVNSGPTRTDSQDFDGEGLERLRVELRMGAGEVKVRGGATKAAHADFRYNVAAWKPEVHFHANGASGDLRIDQPGTHHARIGETTYTWDLQIADDKALDLTAHLGAGEATLNLGTLNLRHVDVNMGVGELRMDLRGKPKHDYDVNIHGGVGEATVHLPRDVGVYASGHGGIGDVNVQGLRKQGDHWVNDAYDSASVRVRVTVEGGIGSIHLIGD